MNIDELTSKVISGQPLSKDEAYAVYTAPLESISMGAQKITAHFFHDALEFCSISNGKSGRCTEDCKFCAQSRLFKTGVNEGPMKSAQTFFEEAQYNSERGVHRFSVVTAGVRLSPKEVQNLAAAYARISRELNISCCGSLGLLDEESLRILQKSGMRRYHCNIETSPKFFDKICSTHSFSEKISTIQTAKRLGLEICSGCILGMGESIEDRIDIALTLHDLEVDSVPINILNPIKGTPLEDRPVMSEEEVKRSIGMFRFVLPRAVLRLAGGRLLFASYFSSLYQYGINAVITGDMLTTQGISIQKDVDVACKNNKRLMLIKPL